MTINIIACYKVKEGMKKKYIALAGELIEKSNTEAGCSYYDLYEDMNDENTLTFIEKWQNQKAVDLHLESEHFQSIVPQLSELIESEDVRLYRKL